MGDEPTQVIVETEPRVELPAPVVPVVSPEPQVIPIPVNDDTDLHVAHERHIGELNSRIDQMETRHNADLQEVRNSLSGELDSKTNELKEFISNAIEAKPDPVVETKPETIAPTNEPTVITPELVGPTGTKPKHWLRRVGF